MSSSQDSTSTTQVLVDMLACSIPRHLHNLAHDSGAHFNMAKSPAWWPTASSADIQKCEAAGAPFLRTEGVLVLKVPLGSDTYVRTQLLNKLEELRTRMQVLGYFQDTQEALLILRVCMGVCRVNFLLRALPKQLVNDAADVFDDLILETFASISCAARPDRVWTAAQVPFWTPNCPGLGLTSAKNIMSAAHLASLNAARIVLSKLLPASLRQALVSTPHVKSTFDDFRSRSDNSAPSFSQLCSEVRHEQKSLVGHVHKKMAEELKQLRPAAELFRVQALSSTGAKEWLTAMPYDHDLRIPPHLMKWAFCHVLAGNPIASAVGLQSLRAGGNGCMELACHAMSHRFEEQARCSEPRSQPTVWCGWSIEVHRAGWGVCRCAGWT
jgi:hypothetical protein